MKVEFEPWRKQNYMQSLYSCFPQMEYECAYQVSEDAAYDPDLKIPWSFLGLAYHRPKGKYNITFQWCCAKCNRSTMLYKITDPRAAPAMLAIISPYIRAYQRPPTPAPPPPPPPMQVIQGDIGGSPFVLFHRGFQPVVQTQRIDFGDVGGSPTHNQVMSHSMLPPPPPPGSPPLPLGGPPPPQPPPPLPPPGSPGVDVLAGSSGFQPVLVDTRENLGAATQPDTGSLASVPVPNQVAVEQTDVDHFLSVIDPYRCHWQDARRQLPIGLRRYVRNDTFEDDDDEESEDEDEDSESESSEDEDLESDSADSDSEANAGSCEVNDAMVPPMAEEPTSSPPSRVPRLRASWADLRDSDFEEGAAGPDSDPGESKCVVIQLKMPSRPRVAPRCEQYNEDSTAGTPATAITITLIPVKQ